ncbi:IS30 family transposase, partial [Polaribacter atrinae]|uniref:IS30 family transposase n=1 Tax=Polaribacter atrinae TaxID=1333662 RepID=UPI0024914AA6
GLLKMAYIKSKEAKEVAKKTIELLEQWIPFIHTITSDNGKEFTNHKQIAQALNIDFYFAKPYHSWQRGANENLNGLVRQYFPKKHNFDLITKQQVELAIYKLNNRPRKRYDFFSPNQMFNQFIERKSKVAFIS